MLNLSPQSIQSNIRTCKHHSADQNQRNSQNSQTKRNQITAQNENQHFKFQRKQKQNLEIKETNTTTIKKNSTKKININLNFKSNRTQEQDSPWFQSIKHKLVKQRTQKGAQKHQEDGISHVEKNKKKRLRELCLRIRDGSSCEGEEEVKRSGIGKRKRLNTCPGVRAKFVFIIICFFRGVFEKMKEFFNFKSKQIFFFEFTGKF